MVKNRGIRAIWVAIAATCLSQFGIFVKNPVRAIQLRDGTVYFARAPLLVNATTTQTGAYVWGATYYFTLELSADAGESLQRVAIAQDGGERIKYDLEDSRAFEGTPRDKGEMLALGEVGMNSETQTVSVIFDPPIPPGKTLTIGLRPLRNPKFGGVYLFGVTVFPEGEKAYGQFIGYGRLQFYKNGYWH